MKEPSAQLPHATNDFCIAPRLAESGAHSMNGLTTMDGLMKEPCAQLQHASARNKRLLYSASSCGIRRSQHERLVDHGRFDERTSCTSSTRNKRLLYSASSCGIWRSQYGHFIFTAICNNCRSNTGVRVDHQHATNDFCMAPRLVESGAHTMDGLITMDGLMKETSAQLQHATNDFCIAPRLAESGSHSMHGLMTMDGLMKEPCAQLQHATNDFCIAPRRAESGAHNMDTSFLTDFPIITGPTRVWKWIISTQQTTFV